MASIMVLEMISEIIVDKLKLSLTMHYPLDFSSQSGSFPDIADRLGLEYITRFSYIRT